MELVKLEVLILCLLSVFVAWSEGKKKKHTTIRPFWQRKGKGSGTNYQWHHQDHGVLLPNASEVVSPIWFGQNFSRAAGSVQILRLDQFVLPMVTPLDSAVIFNQDSIPLEANSVENILGPKGDHNERNAPISKDLERNKLAARPLMCGDFYMVPGEKVSIMSPYFPVRYPNNFRCRWNLQTASDATFVVNCNFFKLARGDTFSAYEIGKVDTLKKFTFTHGPKNYLMDNYFIRLIFMADKRQNTNGFSCQVHAKLKEATSSTFAPQTEPKTEKPETTKADNTAAPPKPQTPAPTQPPPPPLSDPECGIVNRANNRIVHGQFATQHEYPWMTYLEMLWDDGHNQLCGGSLVFDQWVLTAAHCVLRNRDDGSQWTPRVKVTLGLERRSQPTSNDAFTVEATEIKIHPKLSFSHDLTLIKLPSAVTYSDAVRPICLPNYFMQGSNYTGMVMALSGWGKTETGQISDRLRELGRYGIEAAICQKVFGQYITDHHFCTSGIDEKHICLGDSGGPVMTIETGNRFFLTGVVSFVATKDCLGEYPDGHTSVSHFLDWIAEATGNKLS